MIRLTKKQKIAITIAVVASGMLLQNSVSFEMRWWLVGALVTASFLLSVWSLYFDLVGFEFLTLFTLPTLLTATFSLFIIEFTPSLLVRLLTVLIFAPTFYIMLLTENIFNVSAERNIPLLRAAHTVGYLATLFVSFSFFTLLFSLKPEIYISVPVVFIISGLLFLQALWQIRLENRLNREIVFSSLVGGLVTAQVTAVLSAWPLNQFAFGLAITTIVYVALGILTHKAKKDLTKKTFLEYLLVGVSVFAFITAVTNWGT
ncbi:MAG: hypothetical protein A2864_01180 [Candidatus Woykebacteria bacterium RIFCSPHIGHO2_01_FULL_39_12]|uniref:Uncharacterized protein n=1 Tax=Candidatus Woykebacteria bacterium RIFCSPHIGHO2_01_FULL_39_12 TaxID=1802599 RepID=A0A1G1WGX6_9BACT|nr:MAG: hypothetical protein A2864_01180 [Candidatus Woykebacteria bacterium RIFCSPHIGHO2_01_FULL_39_12]